MRWFSIKSWCETCEAIVVSVCRVPQSWCTPPKRNECPLQRGQFKRKGLSSNHYFSWDILVFRGVSLEIVFKMVHPLLWPKQMAPSFLVDVEPSTKCPIKILPQITGSFPSILLKKMALPTFPPLIFQTSRWKLTHKRVDCGSFEIQVQLLAWHFQAQMPCARDTGNVPACSSLDLSIPPQKRPENAQFWEPREKPGERNGFRLQKKVYLKSHGALKNVAWGGYWPLINTTLTLTSHLCRNTL